MTWQLPRPSAMSSHAAHWVRNGRPYAGTGYKAVCGAIVGPTAEAEPGERCGRCLDELERERHRQA